MARSGSGLMVKTFAIAGMMVCLAACGFGQVTTGTTNVTANIKHEATLSVDASDPFLTTGSVFNNYTATTNFIYMIRTTQSTGSGKITVQVTTDFSPTGGPSVATPPSVGDALTYTCTASAPATPCSGTVTAKTTKATSVATFGADAHSSTTGNSGSVVWTLTNDPVYQTGSYTAIVTFTISAT